MVSVIILSVLDLLEHISTSITKIKHIENIFMCVCMYNGYKLAVKCVSHLAMQLQNALQSSPKLSVFFFCLL